MKKQMNLSKGLVLLLALMLLRTPSALSEAEVVSAQSPFCAYAVSDGTIWQEVRKENGTQIVRTKPGEEKTVMYEGDGISAIDVHDDLVYAACENGTIICLDQNGKMISEWDARSADGSVYKIAAGERYAALITRDGKLYVLETSSGHMRLFSGIGTVGSAAYVDDGTFAAAHYRPDLKAYVISILDAQTGSVEDIARLDDVFVDIDALTVLEDGTIYCITLLSQLYCVEDGTAVLLASFNSVQLSGVSGALNGQRVFDGKELYLSVSGALYRIDLEAYLAMQSEMPSLVICGDDAEVFEPRMALAIANFERRNPDVRVQFQTASQEDLVLELMSGSQEYDLFLLEDRSARDMLRAGLFADLRTYPGVMQSLEDWIDIGAMRLSNGTIRMIPTDIMGMDILTVQEKGRADSLGITLPEGGITYKEAEELAVQAREASGFFSEVRLLAQTKQLYAPVHLYTARYCDWMAGDMDYDTDEFRALLQFWKDMADEEMIVLKENYAATDRDALLDNADDFLSVSDTYGAISRGEFLVFPNADAQPLCTVALRGLYLYEYGAQKEKAAEFLSIYASEDAQKELMSPYAVFLKDLDSYVCLPEWTDIGATIYTGIDIDPAGHDRWIFVLEHSVLRPPLTEASGVLIKMMPQYLAGEVTEDELIGELSRAMDLLLNE